MKNIFFSAALSLAASLTTITASAQFACSFSKLNQPYAPLTNATSLTRKSVWTVDSTYTAPIGFTFKMAGTPITTVHLAAGNFISPSVSAVQSGFMMLGTGLMDRGAIQGISKSDIRYTTTGAAGSRIFKLEIYNAGFEDEFFNNGELKDSISLQLWLYEGSNITEFRYGSSVVSNFSDYFGPKMMAGYMQRVDTATAMFEKFYIVNGAAANPVLDSMAGTFSNKGLSSVPANGTVFRFTPKGTITTGIEQVAAGTLAKVYPTQCTNELHIERATTGNLNYAIISLDGQAVVQGKAGTGRTSIDVSALATGTYLIRLSDDNKAYEAQKIIKL